MSHLMFVQLFCIYLMVNVPENRDPGLQAENHDHSIFKGYLGMVLVTLIILIFYTIPWSFKVVAKSMVSARSLTPGWIHGLIYLAAMYFQYRVS